MTRGMGKAASKDDSGFRDKLELVDKVNGREDVISYSQCVPGPSMGPGDKA